MLKEARAAESVDAKRAARLAGLEKAKPPKDSNYASQKDIDEDFNNEVKNTFITKFNKTFTGPFDNTRRAVEKALMYGGVDETSIESDNALSKENAVRSQIIRAIFEAMSQEAISSKKATLKKAYNEDGTENPEWWNRIQKLFKKIKDPKNWLDPKRLEDLINEMIDLGILDDKNGSLFKDRIAAQIGSTADNETLEAIFGKDIYDEKGNLDESKIKVTKDVVMKSFSHIFGDKSGKGGQFKVFATDTDNTTRSISGLQDILKYQSSIIPGIGTQNKNILPIEEREKYRKLLDEVTDSVNKERQAEEAKIVVAQKEGAAISNLSNKYETLSEKLVTVKSLLKQNNGQYATTVSKELDAMFPSGFEGSDDKSFRENAIKYLLEHPEATPEQLRRVGYKGLGYKDKALFEKFRTGQEATTAGTIADSTEQALVYLNKKGRKVKSFEDILSLFGVDRFEDLQNSLGISFADLNDTSRKGQLALKNKIDLSSYDKNQKTWLYELFRNDVANHDEGLFSIMGKNSPLWSLFYGRSDNKNIRQYLNAGKEQFISNKLLAGGDIDNIGSEEQ